MKQQASKRAARRRQERGAVFVEAIIVCTMLILFLTAGLFLHRLYSAKLGAMREARAATWSTALGGCRHGFELDFANAMRFFVAIGKPGAAAFVNPPDHIGSVAHDRASGDGAVRAPEALGGKTYNLASSMQLACNEHIQSERGDLLNIVEYAVESIVPQIPLPF
jgi:hypothetical protein